MEYNNIVINNKEYEILAIFEIEGNSYIALLPAHVEPDDKYYITFYGCTEIPESNSIQLSEIEDDLEFDIVNNAFLKIMEEVANE